MPVPYKNIGPVDATVEPDLSVLKDKNVIVTGGKRSSGLGAGYVQAFLKAGAYVTNADVKPANDHTAPSDGKYQFVQCDVTKFADQVNVFKSALKLSPKGEIDVVIANAGITGNDPVFALTNSPDPEEPDLSIVNIDLIGVLYTVKCAQHYWQFDPRPADEKCLILKSSLAGYLAVPSATQYSVAKYGVRGLLIQLRLADRCRVNLIAPWFIATGIMSQTVKETITKLLTGIGSGWAEVEDSVRAVLRVAADKDINGRALAVVPKSEAKEGYVDCDVDDYPEGSTFAKWASQTGMFRHRELPKEQQKVA